MMMPLMVRHSSFYSDGSRTPRGFRPPGVLPLAEVMDVENHREKPSAGKGSRTEPVGVRLPRRCSLIAPRRRREGAELLRSGPRGTRR